MLNELKNKVLNGYRLSKADCLSLIFLLIAYVNMLMK